MTILVIYSDIGKGIQAIQSHLNSFKKYGKGHTLFYLELSRPENLSKELLKISFDLVIFHYTFLALRFAPDTFRKTYAGLRSNLMQLRGVKVLVPQDEYIYTAALWQIIRDCDVRRIYSCMKEADYPILYPQKEIGVRKDLFRRVFTGYVDDKLLRWIQRHQIPHSYRKKDLVFRSTRSTYAFGMMGQQKTKIAERFIEAVKKVPDLETDICLTLPNSYSNTITGKKWILFLLNSRAALGTLSGSSLFDPTGSIKEEVKLYLSHHPEATDDEIERECYRGRDGTITSYVLGPRHFECAMTKTCQVLLAGNYDKMQPGVDYIEVKEDYSNLDEVIAQIRDREHCRKLAEHCYSVFVEQENLRYSDFVAFILGDAVQLIEEVKRENIEEQKVDASWGIHEPNFQELLHRQEQYLHQAKKAQRNDLFLYKKQIGKIKLEQGHLILSQKIKFGWHIAQNWWLILSQQRTMLWIRINMKLLLLQQKLAMTWAGICQQKLLLSQKSKMKQAGIRQRWMLFCQRIKMLKFSIIDVYYVTGRKILNAIEPRWPGLYSMLQRVRKRRKGQSHSTLTEEKEHRE